MSSENDRPGSRRRPVATGLAAACLLLGVAGAAIQGWRIASGALAYEAAVVSVIGSLMVATMGGMALGLLLRRG